jgi:ribonuclease HI
MYLIFADKPFYCDSWVQAKKACAIHRCTCKKDGILFEYPEISISNPGVFVDGGCVLGEKSSAAAVFQTHGVGVSLHGPHTAPFAELSALKLALDEGASNCHIFTDSIFVYMSALLGFPNDFKYSDHLGPYIMEKLIDQNVRVKKIRGHSGIKGNELADGLCTEILKSTDIPRIERKYEPGVMKCCGIKNGDYIL